MSEDGINRLSDLGQLSRQSSSTSLCTSDDDDDDNDDDAEEGSLQEIVVVPEVTIQHNYQSATHVSSESNFCSIV